MTDKRLSEILIEIDRLLREPGNMNPVYKLMEEAVARAQEMELQAQRMADGLVYVRGITDQVVQALSGPPQAPAQGPQVNPHKAYQCPEEGCELSLEVLEDGSIPPGKLRDGTTRVSTDGKLLCAKHEKPLEIVDIEP